ncbi:MAG: putative monocarboxylate transporter mch1 [Bogoriella megaspora]|nr:MAG: putative monocarboxylate transporter mch1 [Bogoriella megaspora]
MPSRTPSIDKRDYNATRPLLSQGDSAESSVHRRSQDEGYAGSFFEQVAQGIQAQDRKKMTREVVRWGSFAWAIVNWYDGSHRLVRSGGRSVEALCAGSITAYSLYGHLFQTHLRYTQYRVNLISITAELAMYLPVPLAGLLCDRFGPAPCSIIAGVLFGLGYLLAAFTYKSGSPPDTSAGSGNGWPFGVMVVSFIFVGIATSGMYLAAVTTCAKNFGRGKHKGFALAMPIAAFGLSGMWQSQVGDKFLHEKLPDGSKGDVDVYRYFLFLGCTLLGSGIIGGFALRIVNEDEMIDEAVDELERSGLLQDSEFYQRAALEREYGTMNGNDPLSRRLSDDETEFLEREAALRKQRALDDARKKTWLLNAETRHFLADHTMWWLAAGFFLITGPGEAFINNLGSIIPTLYSRSYPSEAIPTSAATHVSIVAVTSTLARIFSGTLSDLLAPVSPPYQHHRGPSSVENSITSLTIPPVPEPKPWYAHFRTSRLVFLLTFSLLLSLGQIFLASGVIQGHAERFWAVSGLIGAGYGAVFSLVPIIISTVWGVENFGTNWGVVAMVPAVAAAVWQSVFAGVYEHFAERDRGAIKGLGLVDSGAEFGGLENEEEMMCYGKECYALTFWLMAVSVWFACGLWLWAWRGPGGWRKRGVAV